MASTVGKTSDDFDTKDKKPPFERKQDEAPATVADLHAKNERGDANKIGSPDMFLHDRYREFLGRQHGAVRIHQVKVDGPKRAYIVSEGSKMGYFELEEGMPRVDAEAALAGAYDGTAVVL